MSNFEELLEYLDISGKKSALINHPKGNFVLLSFEEYKKIKNLPNPLSEKNYKSPNTDVRLYEVPKKEGTDDSNEVYYPEPLED